MEDKIMRYEITNSSKYRRFHFFNPVTVQLVLFFDIDDTFGRGE